MLLLLVIGGLIALWLLTRDDDKKSSNSVVVPNVIGQSQSAAVERVNRRGLIARVVTKPSDSPAGKVFAEEPGAGTQVARKSVVKLSVPAANVVAVPNVVGNSATAATAELRAQGLAVRDLQRGLEQAARNRTEPEPGRRREGREGLDGRDPSLARAGW